IPISEYEAGLAAAGFSEVEIVDTGADLNAYAKVENQGGCCSPAMASTDALPMLEADSGCCSTPSAEECCTPTDDSKSETIHQRLLDLLQRYNVNDFAASVRVYAVKP